MKKILVVDDSALMRSALCDIINSDERLRVEDRATNGLEALRLLRRKQYNAVLLDVYMPVMDGIELLKKLREEKITANILIISSDEKIGANVMIDALELGAVDFIHKPGPVSDCRAGEFRERLVELLLAVSDKNSSNLPAEKSVFPSGTEKKKNRADSGKGKVATSRNKIVAIASSTGGPRALHTVLSGLPKTLDAPVVIVQHMPKDFTESFAERLNTLTELTVTEAKEGEVLKCGHVYLAQGGLHMNIVRNGEVHRIHYSDEPTREGVKPSANYMYESLADSGFEEIICVVLTGMGADGTCGIEALKKRKKIHVVTQDEDSCAVYGMPKSVVKAGLSDRELPLNRIAQEIILNMGVRKDGC